MARTLTLAAIQASYGDDMAANIAKTEALIREAAALGAQVILPSELFQGPYFCVSQEERWFATAHPWREHRSSPALAPLAGELGVVLPLSIFEREGPHYFNSLVMADADGSLLGLYRKSHIPDGAGLPGEVLLPPRRHRLSGLGHAVRAAGRRHLLGPVVPGSGAGDDADGRRGAALSHRDRLGAARSDARHRPALAPRDAGPRRSPT